MRNLRSILLIIMEVVTSLKLNWAKSAVSPVGDSSSTREVVDILGCEVMMLPITYLELPLSANASSKAIWSLVIERVESRLANWKGRYLSKGCRLVLLKSDLSSLPTYFLSVF